MSSPTAHPLTWPPRWPRTDLHRRERSQMKTTLAGALKNVQDEIRRLGGTGLILSSNVTLGADKPQDTGVAAYFTYKGKQVCIPCDRWTDVASNLQAIAKTVEALRGIERWGAKHMIDAAFTGFAALPAPTATSKPWHEVLGFIGQDVTRADIEARFRELAKTRHPDTGGSQEAFTELNNAKEAALAVVLQ